VDTLVNTGTTVTSKVPGPVGTIATKTLQSVGQTVDGILPAPGGGLPPIP
jgi:hypothetical protein